MSNPEPVQIGEAPEPTEDDLYCHLYHSTSDSTAYDCKPISSGEACRQWALSKGAGAYSTKTSPC